MRILNIVSREIGVFFKQIVGLCNKRTECKITRGFDDFSEEYREHSCNLKKEAQDSYISLETSNYRAVIFILIFVSRQENETNKLLVLGPPKCNIFKKNVFLKIFFFLSNIYHRVKYMNI